MNTRYCPSCGSPNQYTAVKPKFCSACSKPFDAAYAAATLVSTSSTTNVPTEEPTKITGRTVRDARGNVKVLPARHPAARQPPPHEEYEGGEEGDENTPYDREQALAEGQELANTINANVFGLTINREDNDGTVVRFSQLPNLVQAATAMAKSAGKAPRKRAKK